MRGPEQERRKKSFCERRENRKKNCEKKSLVSERDSAMWSFSVGLCRCAFSWGLQHRHREHIARLDRSKTDADLLSASFMKLSGGAKEESESDER